MSHSLVKNYVHIVFGTKHREHTINSNYQKELYAYLGGICKNMECYPIKIGGFTNHVHILCALSKKVTLVDLLQELKTHSSKWFKTLHPSLGNFRWATGYASFSVRPVEIDTLVRYIENQEAHHSKSSFEEEYVAFLKEYAMEYDPKYLWD